MACSPQQKEEKTCVHVQNKKSRYQANVIEIPSKRFIILETFLSSQVS